MKEKIISYGCKYRWDQSNWNNNNCGIEHLICCIVMASIHRLPCTVSEKLKNNNEKYALFK